MNADVALLQEASKPPPEVAGRIGLGTDEHWATKGSRSPSANGLFGSEWRPSALCTWAEYPAGRRADPTPSHLPQDTKNVPTFRGNKPPDAADIQLDHVFASRGFHNSVAVRALNDVRKWGASDHCRVLIDVGDE